jgi:2Fe-2S ferredoxin
MGPKTALGEGGPDMLLKVRLPDGTVHELQALDGWRVMEVIRDWGLPIKAECGGACACATCHVWVDPEWVAKLVPPSDEELEMLDGAFQVDERSRLCCQIIMSDTLDGLELELAPESLLDAPSARVAVGG